MRGSTYSIEALMITVVLVGISAILILSLTYTAEKTERGKIVIEEATLANFIASSAKAAHISEEARIEKNLHKDYDIKIRNNYVEIETETTEKTKSRTPTKLEIGIDVKSITLENIRSICILKSPGNIVEVKESC